MRKWKQMKESQEKEERERILEYENMNSEERERHQAEMELNSEGFSPNKLASLSPSSKV